MEDELIIKYIKKKNEKGLVLLVNSYGALIKAIVQRYIGNIGSNYDEECINDILLSIWSNIDSFDGERNNFKNWIGAISKYKALDYKKKYYKLNLQESIDNIDIKSEELLEENLLKKEFENDVRELLNSLNEKDKELFIRYYFKDESLNDISGDLGVGKNTLYNRLSRGRKKMKSIVNSIF